MSGLTDDEYEQVRVDWRSMFVYDPVTKLVRIHGCKEQRAEYAKVMFARKARYQRLMVEYKKMELAVQLSIQSRRIIGGECK